MSGEILPKRFAEIFTSDKQCDSWLIVGPRNPTLSSGDRPANGFANDTRWDNWLVTRPRNPPLRISPSTNVCPYSRPEALAGIASGLVK